MSTTKDPSKAADVGWGMPHNAEMMASAKAIAVSTRVIHCRSRARKDPAMSAMSPPRNVQISGSISNGRIVPSAITGEGLGP